MTDLERERAYHKETVEAYARAEADRLLGVEEGWGHHPTPAVCPTWYDGCRCTLGTLSDLHANCCDLIRQVDRLKIEVEGLKKANLLLLKGMESACEGQSELKQELRSAQTELKIYKGVTSGATQ